MAKNEPTNIHVGAYMSPATVERIDAWAGAQLSGESITRSQAFRMLVTLALDAAGAPRGARPMGATRCAEKAKGLGRCILPSGHRAKHCNSKALDW